MGKLVIQKPAAFEVSRLRKDLADCGWVFGQPKLMGLHLRWDGARLLLAEGGEVTGLPHITRALKERLAGVDLEGEAYIHGVADEITAGMARRSAHNLHPMHKRVEFWLFDVVSAADQSARVKDLIQIEPEPPLQRVPTWRLRSEDMVYDSLARWLAEGFEGIVLRHPLGRWKTGYSAALQKIKPGGEDLYRIVSPCRAKLANNLLLGLLVEGAGGHRFRVHVSPELDRPDLAGKLARVRYTEIGKGGNPFSSAAVEIIAEEAREAAA